MNKAIITVNDESPRYRQRFSAGHELGHWLSDRGKNVFSCSENLLSTEWTNSNREQRANRYAANLLLPDFMFVPRARNQPITFYTVERLADEFQTSLTATAIRLVEYGSYPAMLVCNDKRELRWFVRGIAVPESLWPKKSLSYDSMAIEVLHEKGKRPGPTDVPAGAWFDHPESYRYVIREDSRKITTDLVITLLWWKNEGQILDLLDEEEERES